MTPDEKLNRAVDGAMWRTKSGKLVRQQGSVTFVYCIPKVHCFRTTTSGYHGHLRLDRLEAP